MRKLEFRRELCLNSLNSSIASIAFAAEFTFLLFWYSFFSARKAPEAFFFRHRNTPCALY